MIHAHTNPPAGSAPTRDAAQGPMKARSVGRMPDTGVEAAMARGAKAASGGDLASEPRLFIQGLFRWQSCSECDWHTLTATLGIPNVGDNRARGLGYG